MVHIPPKKDSKSSSNSTNLRGSYKHIYKPPKKVILPKSPNNIKNRNLLLQTPAELTSPQKSSSGGSEMGIWTTAWWNWPGKKKGNARIAGWFDTDYDKLQDFLAFKSDPCSSSEGHIATCPETWTLKYAWLLFISVKTKNGQSIGSLGQKLQLKVWADSMIQHDLLRSTPATIMIQTQPHLFQAPKNCTNCLAAATSRNPAEIKGTCECWLAKNIRTWAKT
jgi:hypothetical protein